MFIHWQNSLFKHLRNDRNVSTDNFWKSLILSDLTNYPTCEFIYSNILETDSDLYAHGAGCLFIIGFVTSFVYYSTHISL